MKQIDSKFKIQNSKLWGIFFALLLFPFALFSQTYHLIENNKIVLSGMPVSFKSPSTGGYYHRNYREASETIHYNDGWRVEVTPDYNAETQRLDTLYFDIPNDVVTRLVVDKSAVQIAAEKEAALRQIENSLDVEKLKYLVRLLAEPVIDTMQMDSTSLSAFTTIYDQWRPGIDYSVDKKVVKDSILYKVIQAHTSQSDWLPENVPSLYVKYQINTGEILEWDFPIEYAVDDLVIYNGTTYKCIQAHTSQNGWTPVAVPALWIKN